MSPDDLQRLGRELVSRRTGLLHQVKSLPAWGDDLRLRRTLSRLPDYGRLPGGGAISDAGGRGQEEHAAFASALFEAVERYCAAMVVEERTYFGKPTDSSFLYGERLPLYAESQYRQAEWPFCRLTHESNIAWLEGRSLVDGGQRWVPAVLVHIPCQGRSLDERLGYCTSTGLACAPSEVGACLSGLLEVCERDAFAIMWLNRLSMPRLHPEAKSPIGQLLRELCCKRSDRALFINLTNDFGAFTVAAVLQRPLNGNSLVSVGAASHFDPNRAAKKALFEAIGQYCMIREILSGSGERWRPAPDYSNVTDFPYHSLLYADPALQPHLDFMTASNVVEPLADTSSQASEETLLRQLVASVAGTGTDVIAVPLTTREVAELGLHVVKIIVPEAVQLNPDHRYPWLGSPRLYRVPRLLGYRDRDTRPDELNLAIPHPFA